MHDLGGVVAAGAGHYGLQLLLVRARYPDMAFSPASAARPCWKRSVRDVFGLARAAAFAAGPAPACLAGGWTCQGGVECSRSGTTT
ncbi:hypothetical protein GCM10025734_02260 [Kitasatospora paranensis]